MNKKVEKLTILAGKMIYQSLSSRNNDKIIRSDKNMALFEMETTSITVSESCPPSLLMTQLYLEN